MPRGRSRSRSPVGRRSYSRSRSRSPVRRGRRSISRSPRRGRRDSYANRRRRSYSRSTSRSRSPSRSISRSRSRSRTPPRVAEEAKRKLYVGKLTGNVNSEHLKEIFSLYGRVVNIDMPTNRGGGSRHFAYVEYDVPEDADKALEHMDGGQIDGQTIEVEHVNINRLMQRRERRGPIGRPRRRFRSRSRSPFMRRRRTPPRRRSPPRYSSSRRTPPRRTPPRRSPPRRRRGSSSSSSSASSRSRSRSPRRR